MEYSVSEPITKQDFEDYYFLRYRILRKPWNQPSGSEKDENEDDSYHAFIKFESNVLAVCRLQMNSDTVAQIRYMAVDDNAQGKGLGKLIISYQENKAKQLGAKTIILQARENAVNFYKSCGYTIKEKSFLMWNEIQHYLMEKEI
jgi:N-acetylglutamate synthase-like GNAT family acetyltransferase